MKKLTSIAAAVGFGLSSQVALGETPSAQVDIVKERIAARLADPKVEEKLGIDVPQQISINLEILYTWLTTSIEERRYQGTPAHNMFCQNNQDFPLCAKEYAGEKVVAPYDEVLLYVDTMFKFIKGKIVPSKDTATYGVLDVIKNYEPFLEYPGLQLKGDCDKYAVTLYSILSKFLPAYSLRLFFVSGKNAEGYIEGHLVLAILTDKGVIIADNNMPFLQVLKSLDEISQPPFNYKPFNIMSDESPRKWVPIDKIQRPWYVTIEMPKKK